jgi:hypothetical protein
MDFSDQLVKRWGIFGGGCWKENGWVVRLVEVLGLILINIYASSLTSESSLTQACLRKLIESSRVYTNVYCLIFDHCVHEQFV